MDSIDSVSAATRLGEPARDHTVEAVADLVADVLEAVVDLVLYIVDGIVNLVADILDDLAGGGFEFDAERVEGLELGEAALELCAEVTGELAGVFGDGGEDGLDDGGGDFGHLHGLGVALAEVGEFDLGDDDFHFGEFADAAGDGGDVDVDGDIGD